ncbi:MAG: hypothetical protein HW375_5 [Anaerolineales bacterium]|nr:hypothetical protein [Anaerolineales bacterium]
MVWKLLKDYRHLAQGGRMAAREDRLGSQRQRQDDAPWTATAVMKADLERALQSLPFERMQLVFSVLCEHRALWRIGEFWGLSPAAVVAEVQLGVRALVDRLNGDDRR